MHPPTHPLLPQHVRLSRRAAIQAGSVGLLGLGMNHVAGLRALAAPTMRSARPLPRPRRVIYIFLSGGLGQHDSFDMKPDAPDGIRGEFNPIATRTPGIQICEHLPLLAERSDQWALVRSHAPRLSRALGGTLADAHRAGRKMPPGFDASKPKPTDWPSMAAIAHTRLPAAQQRAAGRGAARDPDSSRGPRDSRPVCRRDGRAAQPDVRQLLPASAPRPTAPGPSTAFITPAGRENPEGHDVRGAEPVAARRGWTPRGSAIGWACWHRSAGRRGGWSGRPRTQTSTATGSRPISLLADTKTQQAFSIDNADPKTLDRYGRNTFGWSLLIARQLVEAGVSMVQVNLGNDETWDTHGNAFPHLKDFLFPPTDRAVSALLDDLHDRGLLESHADRDGRRNGAHAQDIDLAAALCQAGPRPLGHADRVLRRRRRARRHASSARPTRAAPIRPPIRKSPTTWRPRSTRRWAFRASWPGTTMPNRPHFVYHADPIPGLT